MNKNTETKHIIEIEVMEGGYLPIKANSDDAGFDLRSTQDVIIYPGQVKKIPLAVKMKFAGGDCYASIESKSGLGAKGLLIFAGVIDAGYRGQVHAVMSNIKLVNDDGTPNTTPIIIKKGDKLCQFIPFPFSTKYEILQVAKIEADTTRGAGGFGSSGA